MVHKTIAEDIKQTGWAIRDWLGPYYMLGGAVAFGIGMLTLLDQDGSLHLTRIVGAILFVATFVTWAYHFYKQRLLASAAHSTLDPAPPKAKFHGILLAITVFFSCGIVISEVLMKKHRDGLVQQNTPAIVEPAKTDPAPTPKQPEGATNATGTATGSGQPGGFVLNTDNPEVAKHLKEESIESAQGAAPAAVNAPTEAGGPLPIASTGASTASATPATAAAAAQDMGMGQGKQTAPASSTGTTSAGAPSAGSISTGTASPAPAVSAKTTKEQGGKPSVTTRETGDQQAGALPKTPQKPAAPVPTVAPENLARCQDLNARFSQGDDLTAEDRSFMRNACRKK